MTAGPRDATAASLWERARAGRPTMVVGSLPAPPRDLELIRGRCGAGPNGLAALVGPLGLTHDGPLSALREPLARRLICDLDPPTPAAQPLKALQACRGRAVVVLSRVDRATPDEEAVLREWIGSGDELPLVLVVDRDDLPLVDAARERLGSGAVLVAGAPQAPLASLPTDVLEVLCAIAERGSSSLDELTERTGRGPFGLLVALQAAALRGIALTDDGHGGFTLDPDLVEELRAALLPSLAARIGAAPTSSAATGGALAEARRLVAIGAWEGARRLFAAGGPDAAVEHAALCWALGDHPSARRLLASVDGDDAREAVLGVAWSERDGVERTLSLTDALPEPRRTLDRAALLARHGRGGEARTALIDVLPGLDPSARATALHLLGRLPLLDPPPNRPDALQEARRHVRSALSDDPPPDERARLLETAARLALRAGETEIAAARFLEALPLLDATGQSLALARTAAGLASCAGGDPELIAPAEGVAALDRALRANRSRPAGLVWCRLALQALMERVDVSSRTSLLSDLRRLSLEIAALQAHFPRARVDLRTEPL